MRVVPFRASILGAVAVCAALLSGCRSAGPATHAAPSARAVIDRAAFSWLGEVDTEHSPVLVISFQCPDCLDLIGQCLKDPRFGRGKGPKILLSCRSDCLEDSTAVIAAVLSTPGTPREQFRAVFSHVGSLLGPLLNHDSVELRSRLGALFPRYREQLAAARARLGAQSDAVGLVPGRQTPRLLLADGSVRSDVEPDDLLLR